ncbi:MAG: orotate phosphoribosyltransferase [Lentisphaerae bacterium GWF2_57_35]|nr:MAG: orotate phosphoribosyltransferase [Lentisphaerae bacterium GWF2_57_35]
MNREEAIEVFRNTHALLSGHFELRSGLHSDQFFQCAQVLQYPRLAEKLCRALMEKIHQARGRDFEVQAVISPALGGIPVGQEIGRILDVRAIFAEKQDGKLVLRRAFEVRRGEHFIVAEDVVTRGGRVQETIDIVTSRGGIVDAVVVLVDRSGGKASFGPPMFSLLQLEPMTWSPEDCPLCKAGSKAVHPGS